MADTPAETRGERIWGSAFAIDYLAHEATTRWLEPGRVLWVRRLVPRAAGNVTMTQVFEFARSDQGSPCEEWPVLTVVGEKDGHPANHTLKLTSLSHAQRIHPLTGEQIHIAYSPPLKEMEGAMQKLESDLRTQQNIEYMDVVDAQTAWNQVTRSR